MSQPYPIAVLDCLTSKHLSFLSQMRLLLAIRTKDVDVLYGGV